MDADEFKWVFARAEGTLEGVLRQKVESDAHLIAQVLAASALVQAAALEQIAHKLDKRCCNCGGKEAE